MSDAGLLEEYMPGPIGVQEVSAGMAGGTSRFARRGFDRVC